MTIIHLVRAVTWGGGERYALDLCHTSVEAGYNVVVASKGNADIDTKFKETGAKIERLPLGGPLDFRSPFILKRIICLMPEDEVVIHVHTFKDAEIAVKAKALVGGRKRVRIVCTRHLVKRAKRSPRWNYIFRHIDTIIFVSDLAKRVFLEGRPRIQPEKISVIHNSIIPPPPASPLSTAAAPTSVNSAVCHTVAKPFPTPALPECILLYTGRISPEKGIETLIEAIALLTDLSFRLRIAGTGEEEYVNSLKHLARRRGVAERIDWLGFVPDVFVEIRQADICVAPSLWREPFGLTIIEFMSQGRPVVTTDNGAQPEIITSGRDGMLVPPADPIALAVAIRCLLTDSSERKKLADNAVHTFLTRFAYPIFFKKIMNIYRPIRQ